jgi:hypothetical protein
MIGGSAMQVVSEISTYADLVCALRNRRLDLGLAQLVLDDCAGIQDGYSSKCEARLKNWGQMSLSAVLGAMGCKLVLIADDDSIPSAVRANLYSSGNPHAAKGPPVALPMVEAAIPAPTADDSPMPALALQQAA